MASSISDGNPGILGCYCNPKTSSLSRKHRESRLNSVGMSWGVGGGPTRLYGVGVPVIQHEFRESRESGHRKCVREAGERGCRHASMGKLGKEGAGGKVRACVLMGLLAGDAL